MNWLQKQAHKVAVEVATWPKSLRAAGGHSDESLTPAQRKEAAAILRARADELDSPDVPVVIACDECGSLWHRDRVSMKDPLCGLPKCCAVLVSGYLTQGHSNGKRQHKVGMLCGAPLLIETDREHIVSVAKDTLCRVFSNTFGAPRCTRQEGHDGSCSVAPVEYELDPFGEYGC